MIIFDTLDNLETYLPNIEKIQKIIDILDIGDIYEDKNGDYTYKEDSSVTYTIDSFLTGTKGITGRIQDGKTVIEIVLSGEEIISFDNSSKVFKMAMGRFILTDEPYKRGVMTNLPEIIKTVRFSF